MDTQSAATRWDLWLAELQQEFNEAYELDVILPRDVGSAICRAVRSAAAKAARSGASEEKLRGVFRYYARPYLSVIYRTIVNNPSQRHLNRASEQPEDAPPNEMTVKRGVDTLLFVEERTPVGFADVKAEVLDYLGVPHSIPRRKTRFPWKRLASEQSKERSYLSSKPDALEQRWKRARANRHVMDVYLQRRAKDIERLSEQVDSAAPLLVGMAWLGALLDRVPDWLEQVEKILGRNRAITLMFLVALGKIYVEQNAQNDICKACLPHIRNLEARSTTEIRRIWRQLLKDFETAKAEQPQEVSGR